MISTAAHVDVGHRRDIEGLRAVAVTVVVLYHARLGPVHGGYVGVDSFFVISGYLITRLLVSEQVRSGRVSLANFWARRIRRLLPAAVLVILATVLAGQWMLDPLARRDLSWDALWAGLFSVNIAFTVRGVDYLRAGLGPSPLRHYWSLSVEEQFYLLWPLLVTAAGWWAQRRRHARRSVIGAMVAVGWLVSLSASITLTPTSPTFAYFMLPTRAWELMTGAGVALAAPWIARLAPTMRSSIGWVGLGAVLAAAIDFGERTAFPGWAAALPVLGTAAVVAAGTTPLADGPRLVLDARPLQWIGSRSYAIYLWHWPALVLAEAHFGAVSWPSRAGLMLATLVVAELSARLVENPVRHSSWLTRPVLRSYALGAWAVAAVVLVATFALGDSPRLSTAAIAPAATLAQVVSTESTSPTRQPADATSGAALGSDAAVPVGSATPSPSPSPSSEVTIAPPPDPSKDLLDQLDALIAANRDHLAAAAATTDVPANLRPSLRAVRGDKPSIYDNGCILDPGQARIKPCVFGRQGSDTVVVLYGDSHAAQWFSALQHIASDRGWELHVMTKKRCPSSAIPTVEMSSECMTWRDNVVEAIGNLHPDLVVMSGYRYRSAGWASGMDPNAAWRRGLDDIVGRLKPLSSQVLILGDTPTPVEDVPSCLSGHLRSVTACRMTREQATRPQRLRVEAQVAGTHGVAFIPTSDWLCTDSLCPVIIGDVLAYRDDSHITSVTADLLRPYLDLAVRSALSSAPAPSG